MQRRRKLRHIHRTAGMWDRIGGSGMVGSWRARWGGSASDWGLAEVLVPGRITRFLGVGEHHSTLVRAYGVRELAAGVGILRQRQPTAGVWSRAVGDAVDLGTLAAAFRDRVAHRGRVAGVMALVGGVTALDLVCAGQLSGWQEKRRRAGEGRARTGSNGGSSRGALP